MVCILIYSISNLLIFKKRIFISVFFIIFSIAILASLRIHLLYFLIPSFLIWVLNYCFSNIKPFTKRIILKGSIIIGVLGLFIIIINFSNGYLAKYKAENLTQTIQEFQSYHTMYADEKGQSIYSLGKMDYSIVGLLKSGLPALNVTFIRPYLWETKNIPTLIAAIENILLLLLMLVICFKYRKNILEVLLTNKEITFLLFFAITYGYTVGLTSYNFGALSRYKILSVLFLSICIILFINRKELKE